MSQMDCWNHLELLPETLSCALSTEITRFLLATGTRDLCRDARRGRRQESEGRSPRRIRIWHGQDSVRVPNLAPDNGDPGANRPRGWCGREVPGSPEEEEIGVILDHGVGVTREVAQAGEVEPGARGHLEHAAPRLVAQHLDLGRVEEPRLAGLVLPRQVVVQAVHLLVQRQHLGVHDDLGQLGAAALAQGSPLRGELAAAGGLEPAGQAERGEQQRAQHAGGGSGRRERPRSALRPGRTSLGAWRGPPGTGREERGRAAAERRRRRAAGAPAPPAREAQPWALDSSRCSGEFGEPLSPPPGSPCPALGRDALKGSRGGPAARLLPCPPRLERGRRRERAGRRPG